MIYVRKAGSLDTRPMADLLNAIIAKGGTTAFTDPIAPDTILGWMAADADRSAWHIAENDRGALLGYQSIEPYGDLKPGACDIATFVQVGQTGLGIGSKLFAATTRKAKSLGYHWINATIRADNTGGLAYYQSRGFEDYARHPQTKLANGMIVDKISKRYNL